ncbi:MAG TPA: hypothetical protein VEZ90_04950 [Blastocatellia bacterium]|nr:hypothetical protein [Blastocatellia bacterium]
MGNRPSLYVDGSEFVEWKALVYSEAGDLRLILDSKFTVVPDLRA